MAQGEVGSPKWVAKQIKKKGLQRLRWYCQPCAKQCRDEHGFRLHTQSPSHAAKVEASRGTEQKYSQEFLNEFLISLKTYHGEPVSANRVYNDMIRDPQHTRMTATRFRSLTGFIKYLESKELIEVVAREPEIIIQFTDRDAKIREDKKRAAQAQLTQEQSQLKRQILENAIEAQRVQEAEQEEHKPAQIPNNNPDRGTKIGFTLKKNKKTSARQQKSAT